MRREGRVSLRYYWPGRLLPNGALAGKGIRRTWDRVKNEQCLPLTNRTFATGGRDLWEALVPHYRDLTDEAALR
jgi:hypothetical protein